MTPSAAATDEPSPPPVGLLQGGHVALMGDPTLRMHPVSPPSALRLAIHSGSVNLSWEASPETVLGYHVYGAANSDGSFRRLTESLVTGTNFTDLNGSSVSGAYMVRAVKLEESASGTYFNSSQGIFVTTDQAPSTLTILGIARTPEGAITIIWSSNPGRTYRVAFKSSLADANWTDLSANITAAGASTSFTDTGGGATNQRYYVVDELN